MPRFERKIRGIPAVKLRNPFTGEMLEHPGRAAKALFWEIEQSGSTLLLCSGDVAKAPKFSRKEFENEDDAYWEMAALLKKKRRLGFADSGPSVELTLPTAARPPGSAMLIDEYFAAGDPRFLDEVLYFGGVDKLASLAEPWYRDGRPFARKMLLAYIDDGCDRSGHKALVKRLFKLAEKAADDECMTHFMVTFDRLSRRGIVRVSSWDWSAQRLVSRSVLRSDPLVEERLTKDAKGKHKTSARFSRATRSYLVRRAFRYFRHLGHRDVARYGLAMRAALPRYRDEHLSTGARLLDARGLMHVLYGYSPVLVKAPHGLRLKDGHTLAELEPAPYFSEAWDGVFDELFVMLLQAKSRTVRHWTLSLLRKKYGTELAALPLRHVKPLLLSEHEELALLGAELLPKLGELETLPVTEWLEFLRIDHLDVLAFVCESLKKHVTPARLQLAQCLDLACSKAAPVATIGLAWAKEKPVRTHADLSLALRLTKAGVPLVRLEGGAWCVSLIESLSFSTTADVRELCDAAFEETRAQGLACLQKNERFKNDISLYFALSETPYEDVRAFVIRTAETWKEKAAPATLAHVWSTALLAVHRGGLAKRRVPADIANRMMRHPEEANVLLPILGLALRSVRPPERALALSSLARAVIQNPSLRELVRTHLPEVSFTEQVTA